MATVKRIGPGSAFKIGLVVYALLGLIIFIPFGLIGMVAGGLGGSRSFLPGASLGIFAIVLIPVIYGCIGGVFAAISAFVYNLVAGWVGGLEVEIN